MKKSDLKKMLGFLGFILKCPVCSEAYNLPNIKLIESDQYESLSDAHLLIHSDCQKCKSSVIFNIDISGPDVFTVIAKTDLTRIDNAKFLNVPAITPDDCINLHKILHKFDGDFKKAFAKTAKPS